MILSDTQQTEGTGATLDDLFRRAGVRRPDALALIDPPNGETITGGAPRRLTYAEADRAISALAAKLRGLSLQTDMVVALQLANTVESVIALLGVLRAGMIAAPLPLLWRKQEMVAALSRIGAKAIVTSSRAGRDRHAGGGRAVSDPLHLRLRARSARWRGAARRCVRSRPAGILSAVGAAGPGRRPCRRHHVRCHRRRPRAGRAQPRRADRRRLGRVPGGWPRGGRDDPVDDPARLVCRHRPHDGAVAARRRHAGAASRLRSGRVRRAMPRA